MGTGDEVPPVIEQLGATVEMLGPDALAWGDLSKLRHDRPRRPRLRASRRSAREQQPAARVRAERRHADRAVQPRDESTTLTARIRRRSATTASPTSSAPVQILEPAHPIFNTPNKLTEAAWAGWVQERGLNFLGDKDSRYRDLVQLTDPFPNNPGDEAWCAGRGDVRKGPLDLRRAWPLARAAGRHRWRVSDSGEPDQSWQGAGESRGAAPRPAPATPPRAPARPANRASGAGAARPSGVRAAPAPAHPRHRRR